MLLIYIKKLGDKPKNPKDLAKSQNENIMELKRLSESNFYNNQACQALHQDFIKALNLIMENSKRMIDNYNRDLQVQKEELEKKLEAIQNSSICQTDLPEIRNA